MKISIDANIFLDPRFKVLAYRAGISPDAAIGKCICIWVSCSERSNWKMTEEMLDCFVDLEGFSAALCASNLAFFDGDFVVIFKSFKIGAVMSAAEFERKRRAGIKSGEARRALRDSVERLKNRLENENKIANNLN